MSPPGWRRGWRGGTRRSVVRRCRRPARSGASSRRGRRRSRPPSARGARPWQAATPTLMRLHSRASSPAATRAAGRHGRRPPCRRCRRAGCRRDWPPLPADRSPLRHHSLGCGGHADRPSSTCQHFVAVTSCGWSSAQTGGCGCDLVVEHVAHHCPCPLIAQSGRERVGVLGREVDGVGLLVAIVQSAPSLDVGGDTPNRCSPRPSDAPRRFVSCWTLHAGSRRRTRTTILG